MAKQQRKYRLEIQDIDGETVIVEPPFSIDFEIEKNIQTVVCSGSITIYNLKEATRNAIYKDIRQVGLENIRLMKLFAGYESDGNLSQIFSGTISHCYSRRQGVDFLTVIECNSGSDFLANSYVTMNVGAGTAVRDYMASLAYQINGNARAVVGNLEGKIRRNFQASGYAEKLIKEYTDGNLYLDGDSILILKENEVIQGIVNKINSDSGLLGSPQREENFLLFDIIFEPRILMGQYIQLESSTIPFFNGEYKVVGFHHSGTISEAVSGTAKTTIKVQYFPTDGSFVYG